MLLFQSLYSVRIPFPLLSLPVTCHCEEVDACLWCPNQPKCVQRRKVAPGLCLSTTQKLVCDPNLWFFFFPRKLPGGWLRFPHTTASISWSPKLIVSNFKSMWNLRRMGYIKAAHLCVLVTYKSKRFKDACCTITGLLLKPWRSEDAENLT